MNVNLERFGAMPESAAAVRLIALAAGECVTNCVKHANGNEVRVHISRSEGRCTVAFTNNGKNPAGAVREGVGLSVLRKTVENAGGTMTVHSAPAFKLVIEWTEEEMEKKCSVR